jgi:hypothetical protein
MKFETFEKIISLLNKQSEKTSSLYSLGIDLLEYNDIYYEIINNLMLEIFGKEKFEWIEWFLYEKAGKESFKAYDYNLPKLKEHFDSFAPKMNQYLEKIEILKDEVLEITFNNDYFNSSFFDEYNIIGDLNHDNFNYTNNTISFRIKNQNPEKLKNWIYTKYNPFFEEICYDIESLYKYINRR